MMFDLIALTLIQKALLAATLLGVMCGVLGTFVVVRRISLVGDAVSHSILPGIVLGFVVSSALGMNRNPWVIFTFATLVGLLSMLTVRQILATTRLKNDAALGIVLSGFFGIGLFLKRSLRPYMESAGGLNDFLFGNLATIAEADLKAIFIVAILIVITVSLLLRPFILISFDVLFAKTLGYPVKLLNLVFYSLLTVTIVVSVQAVGVVLVSAMLIIPASSAFLLTDRKYHMMWIAMGFGAFSGLGGCLIANSFDDVNVPNGATMTLTAAGIFLISYFYAPNHGILAKWSKQRKLERVVRNENALKQLYKSLGDDAALEKSVTLSEFASMNRFSEKEALSRLQSLVKHEYLTASEKLYKLTSSGLTRAMQLVRNHRLWELYLTNQADYPSDHVHDDAELIEHVLDEATVKQIEAELGFPSEDPHGQPIPKPQPSREHA